MAKTEVAIAVAATAEAVMVEVVCRLHHRQTECREDRGKHNSNTDSHRSSWI